MLFEYLDDGTIEWLTPGDPNEPMLPTDELNSRFDQTFCDIYVGF